MTRPPSAAAAPGRSLPERGVTFLFTDIEGSTRLAQALGDEAWERVLADHNEIVSAAITASAGTVVSTEGDSFLAVFEAAADGVAAAVAAQQALLDHPWPPGATVRVRMGLHTGDARVRDGDYLGVVVHQGARIGAAAHGGQIVVSDATARACAHLPGDATLQALGRHRLKDLLSPVELLEVRHPALPAGLPSLRTLDRVSHNLPFQASTLVGRRAELAELRGLLDAHRLVTVVGPGGAGKTRLAFHAAAEMVESFPDGVWVVALEAIAPGAGPVWPAAALAAGLRVDEPHARDALMEYVSNHRVLLVFDNCEHVVDAVAPVVAAILAAGPAVRVLATSREPLGVGGERVWNTPGLGAVAQGNDHDDAVALFVVRATEGSGAVVFDEETLAMVGGICARLDRLPLAIEMAAAWAGTLGVANIAARLDDSLRLLVGDRRDVSPRQATMRATVGWSYELLDDHDRALLRWAAVFTTPLPLDAVELIGRSIPLDDVETSLRRLVNKSLVVAQGNAEDAPRYRLLEPVRAFGLERLADAGELAGAEAAHDRWCLDLMSEAPPQGGDAEVRWFDRLDFHHADLLAAIDRRIREEPADAVRWMELVHGFWHIRGHWWAARDRWELVLAHLDAEARVPRATALASIATFSTKLRDRHDAGDLLGRALALLEPGAAPSLRLRVLTSLAALARREGRFADAERDIEEALGWARALGDRAAEGELVGELGLVEMARGAPEVARARFEDAVDMARAVGDRRLEGVWNGNLGVLAWKRHDLAAARVHYLGALAAARATGEAQVEAAWLANLGELAATTGDRAGAAEHFEQAISRARAIGDERMASAIAQERDRVL